MAYFKAEGQVHHQISSKYSTFMMEMDSSNIFNETIALSANGRYFHILKSKDGINENIYSIQAISWIEGIYRMIIRTLGTWKRLSHSQRRLLNLNLKNIAFDLRKSYNLVSKFRGMKYSEWCKNTDTLRDDDINKIKECITKFSYFPQFSIFINNIEKCDQLNLTIASLKNQIYQKFAIKKSNDSPSNNEWVIFIDSGDRFSRHALFWIAYEIVNNPCYKYIYADDDFIDQNGNRTSPRFKPDWSPLYLSKFNYIGNSFAIHSSMLSIEKNSSYKDIRNIVLAINTKFIKHIPAILFHNNIKKNRQIFNQAISIANRKEILTPPPLVTIIIPTRDNESYLRNCIESIQNKTSYKNYEILIIDNGSVNISFIQYLESLLKYSNINVIKYPGSFNYSKINNYAVSLARGEYICFLNDDTKIISHDWLLAMLEKFDCDDVGIVGAKLFYPSGHVQHGGVVVGAGGCANHLHQFLEGSAPGYQFRAVTPHELSAVTAACMLVPRKLFLEIGGFNTFFLKVAFNDVDLCLRFRKSGYRVIFSPDAKLYHYESVSRSKKTSILKKIRSYIEVKYMQLVWSDIMKNDPYYNPNFSYFCPHFILSPAPNIDRPWI